MLCPLTGASMPPNSPDLENIISSGYAAADKWLSSVSILRWVVLLGGLGLFFFVAPWSWYPLILIVISITLEVGTMRADSLKSEAERLKRAHELQTGLNISPDQVALANASVRKWWFFPPKFDAKVLKGLKFASSEPPSARRTLENLRESAWFTKHLAGYSLIGTFWSGFGLVVIPTLAVFLWPHLGDMKSAKQATLISSSIVLGVFSLGVARRFLGLKHLEAAADKALSQAERLLKDSPNSTELALSALLEYQIARSCSPSLPTSTWKRHEKELNQKYGRYFGTETRQ